MKITKKVIDKLKQLGYNDKFISNITPQKAFDIIDKKISADTLRNILLDEEANIIYEEGDILGLEKTEKVQEQPKSSNKDSLKKLNTIYTREILPKKLQTPEDDLKEKVTYEKIPEKEPVKYETTFPENKPNINETSYVIIRKINKPIKPKAPETPESSFIERAERILKKMNEYKTPSGFKSSGTETKPIETSKETVHLSKLRNYLSKLNPFTKKVPDKEHTQTQVDNFKEAASIIRKEKLSKEPFLIHIRLNLESRGKDNKYLYHYKIQGKFNKTTTKPLDHPAIDGKIYLVMYHNL